MPSTPLLQVLLGPALLHAGIAPETLSFVFGSEGSLLSDLCGRLVCWCAFYALIHIFYHIFAPGVRAFCERWYPDAPTSAVPQKLVSHAAFPLYVTVPLLTDFFQVKGWSQACGGIDDCGGPARALLGCAAYFLLLEFIIFVDHYYLLHKWSVGKRLGQHAFHHVYKYADQLNAYSGYSFAPQDGWSQGMALPLATLLVPVPIGFVYLMEVLTGLWTLYIHTDLFPLPWPFMGCDYHYIHHRYNWYNFGFMTLLFDSLFRTVKHPRHDALALSRGELPMPKLDLLRSAELSSAILAKRGREALQSDDASESAAARKAE
ncbi:hypothetical protein EMIHUDRAFT_441353 [Emiliania huxleyi CCMP1516]|uniref:Fatty acid hydroxylase domain-containing protein n=2 Tax=Emiliania huxleyi TaxID=2903 RepID=A0A0D3KE48_EMIH1|nr:hypothetical protein EMIHUDRAFT_441353 [Emiliania huxleyi CCMP1516]EOD34033.1 hypothetical protein EMIHUDRAFT_441353 [Emiliania huxleyi CCMP1516]|eukprot:XP_005786462.1 hypothetical protein EMIHUDRAFT_441353 [Emiliania huxleyi CCMP1516]